MHSVLLIANGPEASISVELLLRRESVVVTRTECSFEAAQLLESAPFDMIVCAIDQIGGDGQRCFDLVSDATEVPTLVVFLSDTDVPAPLNITTSFVSVESGLDVIRDAMRLQLRRLRDVPRTRLTKAGVFEFSFRFPARPDRLARSRTVAGSFIQRCLQFGERELTRLELVVEEALCNAIYHGSLEVPSTLKLGREDAFSTQVAERLDQSPYCERDVEVRIEITGSELQITVADEGPGFRHCDTTPEPETCAPSGRGLLLMQAFADSVEFNERGNEITLTKKLSHTGKPEAPATLLCATNS